MCQGLRHVQPHHGRREGTQIAPGEREPTYDVIGLGCCCWDYLGIVPHYPALDDKVAISELAMQGGGQAGTGIAAVARLGGHAAIVGRVGEDEFGRHIRQAFLDEGVDDRYLMTVPGAVSQWAFIAVDESTGKRTIFYIHGTKGKFAPEDLARDEILDCRCLLIDGHHNEAALAVANWAWEAGVPLVLDLERPQAEDAQLLALASHPVIPEHFAIEFTGERRTASAAQAILDLGPEAVVITMGASGAISCTSEGVIEQPAFDMGEIVDTTGAGDVFHGAFAYGIALGFPLERNLAFASAVAALKCTKLGGRAGMPTMEEAMAVVDG